MLSSESNRVALGSPSTPSRAARVFQTGWRGEIAGPRVFNRYLKQRPPGMEAIGNRLPEAVTVARRTAEGLLPSERWLLRLSLSLYFLGAAELPAVKEKNYLMGLAESTSVTKSQKPADVQ